MCLKFEMTQTHILLVEDDLEISEPLANFLRDKGFTASVCNSAETAAELLETSHVDLVLLDLMLPGKDGLDLCRRIRTSDGPRIIMLTALSEPTDKVVGLELGADDYVCKPFDLRELLARIRAVLRRSPAAEGQSNSSLSRAESLFRFAGYTFDPQRHYLRSPTGLRIPLTGAEANLLLVFCRRSRETLSRAELITLTRGEGFAIAARSVDILVSRIRRKLASDSASEIIRTMRSDGYLFQPSVTVE
jgi:two-component system, OmpR family, response regulator